MSLTRPDPFLSKWAENGERYDVPNSGADTAKGKADIQTGFPEITMKSVLNGGVPPWGQDHNGILYKITEGVQWTQAGGTYIYDKNFCDTIGGYPLGAKIKSTIYNYVTFINMKEGNKENPNDYTTPNEFWLSDAKKGNGWAILTIPSSDNSITYYTSDFKFATTVAGNKTELFVRPSFDGSNFLKIEGSNKPYQNVQAAINDVADGGTATIHIYYPDGPYYTTPDNTSNANTDNQYWNIGNKNITLDIYGNDDLDKIGKEITDNFKPYNKYVFKEYERLKVYMPSYTSHSSCVASGIIGSGNLNISGIELIVIDQVVGGDFNGAFINPLKLDAHGCIFSNIGVYPAIWGGWGGNTTSVKIDQCQFNTKDGSGHFFWLSSDILSLTVLETFNQLEDFSYEFFASNSKDFLGKASSYLDFKLVKTGYTTSDGKGAIYTPQGLNTYLPLTIDIEL